MPRRASTKYGSKCSTLCTTRAKGFVAAAYLPWAKRRAEAGAAEIRRSKRSWQRIRMAIHLRSSEELQKMHRAGLVVHEVLTALRSAVKPGMTTMDLEKIAEEKIAGKPGHAAFKGYRGYPCTLCTSVNSEIVHGIPSSKRKLREGDIVSIDFGMEVD